MKKLLLILGSLSGIALPVTSVIACGSDSAPKRFDTPILGQKINDELLMALLSDPTISPEIKGKYFNDIDFQKAAMAMLEDRVSKLANNYYQSGISKSLMLNSQDSELYNQHLEATIDAIAQNQFYLEYTKNLVSNAEAPLDIQINIGNNSLISLNPAKLLQPDDINDVDKMDLNSYFVFYKSDAVWKRWEYFNENGNNISQIPTIKELETSQFVIVKKIDFTNKDTLTDADIINSTKLIWLDGQDRHDDAGNYVYSIDNGKTPYLMDGKTALQYRFQEYFRSQIRYSTDDSKSLAKRMLAISYLEANLFNVYRNENSNFNLPANDAYLNINSDVAQNVQTWNKSTGYQSKLKMVWSFTVDSRTDADRLWSWLNDHFTINGDGTLTNPNSVSLKAIYDQIQAASGANITNQSNLGSDPFFSLNGYNGIVKNDKETIVSVDGNLVIDEKAKAAVFQTNAPAILSDAGAAYKSNMNGKYDFVFVLPLYLIDLLNDKTQGYDHGLSTTIYVPKANIQTTLDPNGVYTSFSEAQRSDGNKFNGTKINDINLVLGSASSINQNTHDYYIYDTMGAAYTLTQWNNTNSTNYTPQNVWATLKNDTDTKIDGLQVAVKNSHDSTFGNIGFDQPVLLKGLSQVPSNSPDDLFFTLKDQQVYVTALDQNLVGSVRTITDGNQSFNLSFDAATKEGLITTTGTINKTGSELNNTTYGNRINMGQNSSNPNSYVKDNNLQFDFYEANTTSLDVTNLNTANKTSLLREIESIVAKDETVINRASTAIYPLFLKQEDILFNPLYESLKKYLINEGGGTSD